MPGKAKRKYEGELIRFAKYLRQPLELVVETLKPGYIRNDFCKHLRTTILLSGGNSVKGGRFILKKISF